MSQGTGQRKLMRGTSCCHQDKYRATFKPQTPEEEQDREQTSSIFWCKCHRGSVRAEDEPTARRKTG